MTRRFDILLTDGAPPVHDPWCWRDDWHAPGESAFSLLAKFQRLNALSCSALAESFASLQGRRAPPQDLDLRDARRFDLLRMRDMLRLRLADIAAAFVMPSGAIQRISSPTLRWCVQCAQQGVHLAVFQYRRVDQCPVHRVPLVERCERCDKPIPYRLRADLFRAPFNCPSCGNAWWVPAQGLDDIRVGQPYRRRLGKRARHVRLTVQEPTGSEEIWCATGGLPSTSDELPPVSEYQLPLQEMSWVRFGTGGQAEADDPWPEVATQDKFFGDRDAQAHACYKAVRRQIMRMYGRNHRACIKNAARHLAWSLCGSTTTSCCPVALAYLRWRCKWEGVGIPRSLLQQPVHGPLGLTVWLSLHAPIAPRAWSREAAHWLTLHALAHACMDSFYTYLEEAQGARRVIWLPFPVHDFLRRGIVMRGGALPEDPPQQLCIMPVDPRYGYRSLAWQPGTAKHRREHLEYLDRNISSIGHAFGVPPP
ncbi:MULTISPECIES: TniQ family protein [Burkholderia]|uniref:TniQ family protein n=1 Tax=Burkholderia TaxID=32008 RepID=UPI0009BDC15C|nr:MULTISPECIES: TniQ family protein [Burkholderia]AXK68278.1 hypothetical protein DCN14_37560 [Burkholderia sp. IDO3]PCD59738.1 hypothetical protein CN645_21640 [Burkholderia sp. IDO3]